MPILYANISEYRISRDVIDHPTVQLFNLHKCRSWMINDSTDWLTQMTTE